MKKFVLFLSFCVVTCGALLVGCSKSSDIGGGSGPPVEMKVKWDVGKKYVLHMDMIQNTEMELPNQSKPMKQEMNFSQEFDISALKELANGGRQLELHFVSQTMDSSMGGRKVMSFDSAQDSAADASNPAAPMLRKLVGARIRYLTDAEGKVEKVEGVQEIVDGIAEPRTKAMFQQTFSEEIFKQYGSFADAMPDHPVKLGETWPIKRQIVTPVGVLTMNLKYTFKDWEQHNDRRCMRLEFKGDISAQGTATANAPRIEKGVMSGKTWFDPELGMIVDSSSDQTMTMKVAAQGKTMTPQISQKIHLNLVEVTEVKQ